MNTIREMAPSRKREIQRLHWHCGGLRLRFRRMTWVLFFDDGCAFCSGAVRRVARRDKRARVFFAPLQGELARKNGLAGDAAKTGGTMVLLRESDGAVFTRGDAVLELASLLGGAWRLLRIGKLLPKSTRDVLYDLVAGKRHRLPGANRVCEPPDAAFAARLRK
jgi:predicted DCC family thiol-disulfide oxidoreductase YuxK